MINLKQSFYWILKKLFNYSRPLPPDHIVLEQLQNLISSIPEGLNEFTDKKKNSPPCCCMYIFQEGGIVLAPDIKTKKKCDKWGDWWEYTQNRPGAAQFLPTPCPKGQKAYAL